MNSQHDESALLAFVRREEDGRNKICIYGTPGGLRKLASELVKQSEANQDHLADYDTDYTHYRATHQNAILAPSSDEVVLGRLDLRNGELATWARERIDDQWLPRISALDRYLEWGQVLAKRNGKSRVRSSWLGLVPCLAERYLQQSRT